MATDFLCLGQKVVIITGASSGIGEGIALEFARQGSYLMLTGRDDARTDEVKAKCLEVSGGRSLVETTVGDVNEESVRQAIVDNTLKHFGHIDVLVNNAGLTITRSALATKPDEYEKIMKTNMDSVFFLTQLAVPFLKQTKGNIVNMSSIVSARPVCGSTVYSMSKAALDCYSTCLAVELAPSGVRVNCVNPGTVISKIYLRGDEAMNTEQYAEFLRKQASPTVHPLGRVGVPSEVADAVVFLASLRANFVTGQVLFVDGGRHCLSPLINT